MYSFKRHYSSIFVGILFFFIGFVTLPHYGVDWDTINHFPRGQAYLHFFLTGDKSYKDLPAFVTYYQKDNTILFSPNKPRDAIPKRSLYQFDGYGADYFLAKDGGHPPLSDILAAISNVIFFQQLRLFNDIDSYHIYIIFVASVLVSVTHWWTKKYYGIFAANIASLSLALYPLFLSESHFNVKDIPEAAFYSFTILFFAEGVITQKKKWIFLAALFFGLALGTKFNIVFSPLILLCWLSIFLFRKKNIVKKITYLLPALIAFPVIAISIFYISWPFLWSSPFVNFLKILNYYKTIGINPNFDQRYIHFGFNTYASEWILYSTPVVVLFFTFFGILYTLRKGIKEANKTSLLILFWFSLPILRVTLPNAGIYGGVRQIMEYIPAMAILAGIGAWWIRKKIITMKIVKNKTISIIVTLCFFLFFIPLAIRLIEIHPNENVYFNELVGGLKGARDKDILYAGNSFGNAYRQGVSWINANLPKNAKLVFAQDLMTNIPSILVREDINFTNTNRSGYLQNGEYVIALDFNDKHNRSYYSSQFYARYLKPIHQIRVDDKSIVNIWKNDKNNTYQEFRSEKKVFDVDYSIQERGIMFDLKKPLYLSRIEWGFTENNCKDIKSAYFEVSVNGNDWTRTPHTFPTDRPIPTQETQPYNNQISYPFAAERARYIFANVDPEDSCIKNITSATVYYLPNVGKNTDK